MSMLGIDVSEHNGALDWAKIKAAGVEFAIVRSGYGTSHVDNFLAKNIRGAREQGLPVGIYHFSYALDPAGAKKEAEFVLSILKPFWGEIFLPIFFDFEYDSVSYAKKQGVTLGRESFNAHAVAFCETIRAAGYTPGVYYNLDYARNYVDRARLGGYVQWFAQYASAPSRSDWAIWQYSSSHTIPGISGKFDANLLGDERLLGESTKNMPSVGIRTKPAGGTRTPPPPITVPAGPKSRENGIISTRRAIWNPIHGNYPAATATTWARTGR